MIDYGQMHEALESLRDDVLTLDGEPCPKGCCFGTLQRRNGRLVCTGCSVPGPARAGR